MTPTLRHICFLLTASLCSCDRQAEAVKSTTSEGVPSASTPAADTPQIEALKRQGLRGQALQDVRRLQERVRNRTYDGERADNDFFFAGLEEPEVSGFLKTLKAAVATGDRRKLASLVQYPTMVTLNGQGDPVEIKTPEEFVAKYDSIVNGRVLSAIKDARLANLFANWQGVSMGRGAVWFGAVCTSPERTGCTEYIMKITKINNRPLPGGP